MKIVEDYRQQAEECRQLASRARTPEERDMILHMAATWEELARSRERTLKAAAKST
jgi:hypothetical protein